MAFPIAVQLYSVRDYIAKEGFAPVLKRIADIGYKGVEPAGFFGVRPSELKKMVDDLGLKLYSTHSPWARKVEDLPEQLDIAAVLGLDTIVCGFGPGDDALAHMVNERCRLSEVTDACRLYANLIEKL